MTHPGLRAVVPARGATTRTPLVFVHGGAHTGAAYLETPDGRLGWAPYLAQHGRTGYVYDWPGRGARPPDEAFVRQSLGDVARDLAELLAEVGPAVLVTHSMGGVVGWRAAELVRDAVAGIVAIAPGPPANLQPALDAAAIAELRKDDAAYARLGRPLAHPEDVALGTPRELVAQVWMNSTRFPREAEAAYLATIVPESPRALNERNNIDGSGITIAGPSALAGIPILIITGDDDPRHPRETDEAIATYFGADFLWLADAGLPGHGHMQMIEHGNLAIADLFEHWLETHTL
jgi:pimeloyl-ACP methyl ester carboxylesterase